MFAAQTVASCNARPFVGTRLTKTVKNGSKVFCKAGNWLPGKLKKHLVVQSKPPLILCDPLISNAD